MRLGDGRRTARPAEEKGATVSWQEELRKLDEELASGRLSADDYRARRDQVLSSAVAQGESSTSPEAGSEQSEQSAGNTAGAGQDTAQHPPQPAPGGTEPDATGGTSGNSSDATQIITPVSRQHTQQGAGGAAAAASGAAAPGEEPTQSVPGADNSAERTQAVPSWQTQQAGQGTGADPERTQVVSSQQVPQGQQPSQQPGPQSGPAGPPGPAQGAAAAPWNAPHADVTPPWSAADMPSGGASGGAEGAKQGPEVFDQAPRKGNGGKIALIVAAVVVVLAGLTVGGIFAFNGGQNQAEQTPQAPPPPPPAPPPPPVNPAQQLLEKIPNPAGTQDPNSGSLTGEEVANIGVLDPGEIEVLGTRSVNEVAWRGSQKAPNQDGPTPDKFSLMVIPAGSPDTAAQLADQLRQYETSNGYVPAPEPLPDMPANVALHKKITGFGVYLGTWVSGNNLIRVHVSQDPLTDENALGGSYQGAVKAMLGNYPATQ